MTALGGHGGTTHGVDRVDAGRVPRRRGAVNGVLLVLLGAWGAVIPFIGPYLGLAYTPDRPWVFTGDRLLLHVLPGLVVLLGGLGAIASTRRGGGVFWAWLAALGGAWFVVGPTVSRLWNGGAPATGDPAATNSAVRVFTELVFFTGLGALILLLAGIALGRFSFGARTTVTDRPDPGVTDRMEVHRGTPAGTDHQRTVEHPTVGQYGSTETRGGEDVTAREQWGPGRDETTGTIREPRAGTR